MNPILRLAPAVLLLVPGTARAQANADTLLTVAHYLDLEQAGNPQISPDGKTIGYTRSWVDKINDKGDNAIWIMNADGTKNRVLAKGSSPGWSPHASRITYLAEAAEPKGNATRLPRIAG